MPEAEKGTNWFLVLIGVSAVAVIASSFYFLYFQKNYEFIVEVSCDITEETCVQRDCSNAEDCPPNGLSDFKRYSLNAADFDMCENEDCENACESGKIKCEPIPCTEDILVGETCISRNFPQDVSE